MTDNLYLNITFNPQNEEIEYFLLQKDQIIKHPLTSSSELFRELRSLCEHTFTRAATYNRILDTGKYIYQIIIPDKLKEYLKKNSVERIHLALDEILYWIPFEIAFDKNNFFCFKYDISRSRISDKVDHISSFPLEYPIKIGLIFDPTSNLAEAQKEGTALIDYLSKYKSFFSVNEASGKNATRAEFRELFETCDIVHYSGHIVPEPSTTFQLADGMVSVKDILNYQKIPFIIFANACHSIKIIDSALSKRLTNYIGSFTEIDDPSSFDFAINFYNNIAQGINISRAVRNVKRYLYNENIGKNNYTQWAMFFYHGHPDLKIVQTDHFENMAGYEHFTEGLKKLRHGKLHEAEKYMVQAESESYKLAVIYSYLGIISFLQGNLNKADNYLKRSKLLNTHSSKLHFWLGRIYLLGHYTDSVVEEFNLSLLYHANYDFLTIGLLLKEIRNKKEFNPMVKKEFLSKAPDYILEVESSLQQRDDIDNKLGLALLYSVEDRPEEAIKVFQQILIQDTHYLLARYYLIDEYKKFGTEKIKDMIVELEYLRKNTKGNINLYSQLGELYYKLGNFQNSAETMFEGLKYPEITAQYYFNMALAYHATGDTNKAVKYYREAIQLDEDFTDAYYNSGVIYQERGGKPNQAKAARIYNKILNIDPHHNNALNNLGVIQARNNYFFKAINLFRKAHYTSIDKTMRPFTEAIQNYKLCCKKRQVTDKTVRKSDFTNIIVWIALVIFSILIFFIVRIILD